VCGIADQQQSGHVPAWHAVDADLQDADVIEAGELVDAVGEERHESGEGAL